MTGMPDMWSTYLRSDDAAATVQAAAQHGGQVYMEPMDIPEQGRMAMIADATGASVGHLGASWDEGLRAGGRGRLPGMA